MKTIVLKRPVRSFTKSPVNSRTLTHAHLLWFQEGEELNLGDKIVMVYDHREQKVLPILDQKPERFFIASELEEVPWFTKPPLESSSN